MNKTEKRQLDLRNKLIAAVAMLLVSCIMMVSTTYAWFTLSTAPEVQGITTTVGANGNLEIALSPYSGDAEKVTSQMGDALKTWDQKNLTWGNLLNLENNSIYGLNDVKLLPARLNFTGNAENGAYVGTAPLSTPIYGADGRPSKLEANTMIGSKHNLNGDLVNGFGATPNNVGYGVRVVGTSDSMTETQIIFNEALADLANAISSSNTAAANSLNNHGSTLAGVMINYGLGNSVTYGATELGHVEGILNELESANAYLLTAIKSALLAEAASDPGEGKTFSNDKFTAAKALAENITAIETYLGQYPTTVDGVSNAVDVYKNTAANLAAADGKLSPLVTAGTATFDQLKEVLNYVMNTASVTVNGMTVTQIQGDKGKLVASIANQGVNIRLGAGSGIYSDIASAVGNLQAKVAIPEFTYNGDKYSGTGEDTLYANMTTTSAVNGGYMTVARTRVAALGAYAGEGGGAQVINVPYAYMIDFMFRTNAQGSSLKLQTSDAQRVYTDSTSEATQGMGSEMTFDVTDTLSLEATLNLMKSIRVVFMDTASSEIYGIGKLDVDGAIKKNAAGEDVTKDGVTDTTVASVVANLYLYSYEFVENAEASTETAKVYDLVVSNNKIDEANAVLCALPANTAKKVTSMVYLDGDNVTNADVANGDVSLAGTLNLQFASTAVLVPMENTALKDMEVKDPYTATLTLNGTNIGTTELKETSYSGEIGEFLTGHTDVNVVVKMGGEVVDDAWDSASQKITISEVTGNVEVIITSTPPTQP